jgi:uncharacterized protein (DUF924 family)
MADDPLAASILEFWFAGDEDARRARYWKKDEAVDTEIRERFGSHIPRGAAGSFNHWCADADGALALVILLDQMSRNSFRGDVRSWASDAKAREVARAAIAAGFDRTVDPSARLFFYLPLEHAEDLATQEECVVLCKQLTEDQGLGPQFFEFAIKHRDIIARFGRFPHRNAVLGRESTDEEIEFLKGPGSSF